MSGNPAHHLVDLPENCSNGQSWPVDKNDRKSQDTGRLQLGFGPCTTRVLGNDVGDAVGLQKRQIIRHRKGPARDDRASVRQGQRAFGTIDKAQKIVVLRLSGEAGQMQLADRKKDPRRNVGQGIDGLLHPCYRPPVVVRSGDPGRAFKGAELDACLGAGFDRVATHLCCERMGGVDQMREPFGTYEIGQPLDPAKAADTGGQGLGHRLFGTARIGKDRRHPGVRHGACQMRGFGGSTEDKEARHYG